MSPALASDFLTRPRATEIAVALEPAHNVLTSMLLISMVDQLSGLGDWVNRTAARMSAADLQRNRLIFEGLYFAVLPDRRWPSFTAYLEDLERAHPAVLRDRLLRQITRPNASDKPGYAERARPEALLADVENYLDFLRTYMCAIDEPIERETHALLNDLPAMQRLIVTHLRELWQGGLATEWERVVPMLHDAVGAFQQIDFSRKTGAEAMQLVLGREPDEKWQRLVGEARQVIFVPSAHIGPYLRKCMADQTIWVVFGARQPESVPAGGSALSRSDLLVRLGALTDDTRLRILALLSQHDELCAQDIMTMLDLTQSATSRHLRQLSASGYITERRRDIAKCYALNRERIGDTFQALERFLAQPSS